MSKSMAPISEKDDLLSEQMDIVESPSHLREEGLSVEEQALKELDEKYEFLEYGEILDRLPPSDDETVFADAQDKVLTYTKEGMDSIQLHRLWPANKNLIVGTIWGGSEWGYYVDERTNRMEGMNFYLNYDVRMVYEEEDTDISYIFFCKREPEGFLRLYVGMFHTTLTYDVIRPVPESKMEELYEIYEADRNGLKELFAIQSAERERMKNPHEYFWDRMD